MPQRLANHGGDSCVKWRSNALVHLPQTLKLNGLQKLSAVLTLLASCPAIESLTPRRLQAKGMWFGAAWALGQPLHVERQVTDSRGDVAYFLANVSHANQEDIPSLYERLEDLEGELDKQKFECPKE